MMNVTNKNWSRRNTLILMGGAMGSWLSLNNTQSIEDLPSELPDSIAEILLNTSDPDTVLTVLMPAVVDVLQCDRCFLYIRDPQQQRTRITHGYSREARWPTMVQTNWSPEPSDLNTKDPLTLSAYQSSEAHFIEDIEAASPGTLDINLERSVFGHRALIHAPIYSDDEFYGILEPCVFEVPRRWTDQDRVIIQALQHVLGIWIIRYLQSVR